MFPYSNRALRDMAEPATQAFEFWVSFWPVAPVFGVKWRFADMAEKMTGGVPLMPTTVHSGARPKPRTATKAKAPKKKPELKVVEAMETIVEEVVEAAKVAPPVEDAALEPQVEKAEAAIEEVMEAAAPVDPVKAETKAEIEAETKADEQASLDLAEDDAVPSKPKGLLKSAPKKSDDLKLIKGIGPGLEKQLNGLGVYSFAQIAGFSDEDLAWVDDNLTAFKGRCFRDDWVGQAKAKLH